MNEIRPLTAKSPKPRAPRILHDASDDEPTPAELVVGILDLHRIAFAIARGAPDRLHERDLDHLPIETLRSIRALSLQASAAKEALDHFRWIKLWHKAGRRGARPSPLPLAPRLRAVKAELACWAGLLNTALVEAERQDRAAIEILAGRAEVDDWCQVVRAVEA